MHTVAKYALGLAAGIGMAFLVDRFLLPGTLYQGIAGVVFAIVVLGVLERRKAS